MRELTPETKIKLTWIKDLAEWHQKLLTQDKHDIAEWGTVREWADKKMHIKTSNGWRIANSEEIKKAKKIGPIERYTKESRIKNKQKKKSNILKRKELKSKSEIHNAIQEFQRTKEERIYNLGKIAPKAKRRIKAITGLEPETVILETGSITHALNPKHKLKPNDLDEMKDIVDNSIDIQLSPEKNKEGQPVIVFRKQEPNGLFLLMEFRAGKYELELQTAYRKK